MVIAIYFWKFWGFMIWASLAQSLTGALDRDMKHNIWSVVTYVFIGFLIYFHITKMTTAFLVTLFFFVIPYVANLEIALNKKANHKKN